MCMRASDVRVKGAQSLRVLVPRCWGDSDSKSGVPTTYENIDHQHRKN